MGEVYRGFNIQTRDPVAIKMIRPELSNNPDVFDLFRREASILHTLQHEAIVRYFVFSVDPDLRRAYLAMEFVDGPSLTSRLASGPLPLADVRILQKRIGSALDTAHRLGVVHRDISSDNVILPDDDVRSAKIIDFGIARSHRPGEGTIIGDGFAGKYNYVSPEQLGLAGGDVTLKSDIYSFGLVLAEALRGRPIDMSGSQAEVIEKRRAVPDLAGIDTSIRPLIQAMLQPLPANRPQSMAAVAAWEAPGRAGLVLPRAGAGKAAGESDTVRRARGRDPRRADRDRQHRRSVPMSSATTWGSGVSPFLARRRPWLQRSTRRRSGRPRQRRPRCRRRSRRQRRRQRRPIRRRRLRAPRLRRASRPACRRSTFQPAPNWSTRCPRARRRRRSTCLRRPSARPTGPNCPRSPMRAARGCGSRRNPCPAECRSRTSAAAEAKSQARRLGPEAPRRRSSRPTTMA